MTLSSYLTGRRAEIDRALTDLLPAAEGPAGRLAEAMRYAVFSGGKRLRPLLAVASCEALGGDAATALAPAAALELIHTYSLVHDDLPAMDDDDLRRGRPTVHRAFGEAEAILAGDALLTLAFEILSKRPDGAPFVERRLDAVTAVARAAGHAGMVGGQLADLLAERRPADEVPLEWIHRQKTGALLSAAAEVGAIHAGASLSDRQALARYGAALGLAFQIADDLLDRTATVEALGKTPGKDERSGKATYPARFGVEASRAEARRLADLAVASLPPGLEEKTILAGLAEYAVSRTH